jgi:uncharacterized protein (DUF302 family)
MDVYFKKYRILGASIASQALLAKDKIGVMLHRNVFVEAQKDGTSEVLVVDPLASMQRVENDSLKPLIEQVRANLKKAIDRLSYCDKNTIQKSTL